MNHGTHTAAAAADDGTPFARLWHGFLGARIVVALVLLALQGLAWALNPQGNATLVLLVLGYLAAAVALRVWAPRTPPAAQPGVHWLPSIGVDIAFIALLQWLQSTGGMNYTPLFGFPVLMASVLGTLVLALGTTAAVTLALLAWAWWLGGHGGMDLTQRLLDAGLTGAAYFVVASLTHLLATRLTRVQQQAHTSHADARVQRAVSALVIQHVADGVLVLDQGGQVRLANPAALQLLGLTAYASVPFTLAASPRWQPLVQLAQDCFSQDLPHSGDVTVLHQGQSPLGLHVRAWPTQHHGGAPAREQEQLCVMFLHDQRELEARLRTEKLAAMGRMSAAVAHEIRNPLAAIMQANELLDEELADPRLKRLTDMVRQNAERLVRTTEDVLDIARVQHQIQRGDSSPLQLDACVQQIWHDWCAQDGAHRGGTLLLHAGQTRVGFDAEHLRRVLVNLFDNAQRYISGAPDALIVQTQVGAEGQARLQVWSDGAPLEKSVQHHLFEPFFSSESRSSGLGLYICRELCQRHGASIRHQRVVRELARGTTPGNAFIVEFRATSQLSGTASLFDALVV